MIIKGKLVSLNENGTATFQADVPLGVVVKREVKDCYIELVDGRKLSDNQRKMCYALINAIAEWSGSTTEEVKQAFKLEFWVSQTQTLADKIFSLSNAPMSLIAEFQRFLVAFILTNDIPTKRPLVEYVDDIEEYTYLCVVRKKCCVCGRHADLHHIDAVGMGNDRTEIHNIGREVITLCREHHTEIHAIGKSEFMSKYHLDGGVIADKTICKVHKLKE